MRKLRYVALYLLKGAYHFYIGCGDENRRISSHKLLIKNHTHSKKIMSFIEQHQKLEYHLLIRLPYSRLNNDLLKKIEKILITELHNIIPSEILNTKNYNYNKSYLCEHEFNLYNALVNKITNVLIKQ